MCRLPQGGNKAPPLPDVYLCPSIPPCLPTHSTAGNPAVQCV